MTDTRSLRSTTRPWLALGLGAFFLIWAPSPPAGASGLTVATALPSYNPGATVVITGATGSAASVPVALEVDDPAGDHVFVDQVTSTVTGAFADSFTLGPTAPAGTYAVLAAAPGGLTGEATFTVVHPAPTAPLTVQSTGLPGATVGVSFSASLQAAGGIPPYRWSVVAGSLPAGLTLAPDGTLSGTPTSPGLSAFTVQVTDGETPADSATATFGLLVAPTGVSVAGTSQAVLTAPSGAAPAQVALASGGTTQTEVEASGVTGTLLVAAYGQDPAPGASGAFGAGTAFFDVALADATIAPGASLTITQCAGVGPTSVLQWLDHGTWRAVQPTASFANGCLSVTLKDDGSTVPSIAQLVGTPFAVMPPPAVVVLPGGVGTTQATAPPPAPTVLGVSPSSGPASGGTQVTISGSGFAAPVTVRFGTEPATAVTVVSPSTLEATAPPGSGTVDVTVTDAGGTSVIGPSDRFTYLSTQPTCTGPSSFQDVPAGSWEAPFVEELACHGIISGYPDGTFRPSAPVTRAEFVKMLVLALGLQPLDEATPFQDVPPSSWYGPYVAEALAAGLVNGLGPGRFGPMDTLTREQMATLLARALHLTGSGTLRFRDAQQIAPWAEAPVAAAVAAGYLDGFPNGTFQPLAPTTRAQAAKVLDLVWRRVSGGGG
jgi:hypothetical protein